VLCKLLKSWIIIDHKAVVLYTGNDATTAYTAGFTLELKSSEPGDMNVVPSEKNASGLRFGCQFMIFIHAEVNRLV
jgi:hypothetical protein